MVKDSIHTTHALLKTGNSFMGHAIFAPISGRLYRGVVGCITPVKGMAQGRIMPISRGDPPPKKR